MHKSYAMVANEIRYIEIFTFLTDFKICISLHRRKDVASYVKKIKNKTQYIFNKSRQF